MNEDDAQPPFPHATGNPRKPRKRLSSSQPRPQVTVKDSRRSGREKNPVAVPVPKLDAESLATLSAHLVGRSKLRMVLHAMLVRAQPDADARASKIILGRYAREGRDLGQPLEVHRHHMLVYMDAVLCGRDRMRADPLISATTFSPVAEMVGRTVFGWKRQLERHLEANPDLKLSAAEAMGMPDDDHDE